MVDTSIFTDPKQFFEGRELDLKIPIGIVVAIVLVRIVTAVINAALIAPQVSRQVSGPAAGGDAAAAGAIGGLIGGVFAVVLAIVAPLIAWVLFTAIFYGLSEVLGDDPTGEFTDVLAVTAWGFIPRLITLVVVLLLAILSAILLGVLQVDVTIASFIGLLGPVVGVLMTFLSAYIWGNGLAVVRGITPKQGYICTLPVVLFGLLFTVLGILSEILSIGLL
ncbi:MAG: YIP1 family protein [Haloferacaceae archaeon]